MYLYLQSLALSLGCRILIVDFPFRMVFQVNSAKAQDFLSATVVMLVIKRQKKRGDVYQFSKFFSTPGAYQEPRLLNFKE